ncbi:MAG: hypothetical protein B6I25_06115 [Planctomycetales bacterium 4572_13]|nr:MAG: hypothetical protein B6I25_06115 [Planctomycetales bacterium 4572_13]
MGTTNYFVGWAVSTLNKTGTRETKAARRKPPDITPMFLENAGGHLNPNRSARADALLLTP